MTKEQFLYEYFWSSKQMPHKFITDLEAVIAHEIEKVKEPQSEPTEQPANSFDKDRFEAMFRAVVASGELENITEAIEQTEYNLNRLDAYYASKEGGANV